MNALVFALSSDEFSRICSCEMVKERWDVLEVTHECTNQVKDQNQSPNQPIWIIQNGE